MLQRNLVFNVVSIFCVLFLTGNSFAATPSLILTQKDVAQLIIEKSQKSQETNFKYLQMRLAPAQSLTPYDWSLSAENGYELDKTETLANPTAILNQRYKTSLALKKNFITGTNLGLEFSRNSLYTDSNSATNTSINQNTADLLGITLEQNLWRNSFGIADRSLIESTKFQYQANSIIRANELQDLVLESLRLYWNTYVAEENFNEATASRERYKKFVEAVRKKTSYGYSNPGELFQVQAELENREQLVKTASNDYLKNLESMTQSLQLPKDREIIFPKLTEIPDAPKLPSIDHKNLRALKSQELKIKAAESAMTTSQSNGHPVLSLVGNIYTSGLSDTASISQSHLISGSYPKYYVGIKFLTQFGSDFQTEDQINKKVTFDLEKIRYDRMFEETANSEKQAERKVQTTYYSVLSKKKQRELREKAMNELQRSFNQGRTDIGILIDAMNRFFDSEILYTRSVGDYFIALNEWAALRDELIPNQEDKL